MAGRRSKSIAALVLTLCIAGGLAVALNPVLVFGNGLEWGVSIGTTLDFGITCRLFIDNETAWTPGEAILEALSLNGTAVTANVTLLPAVRYVRTADDFADSVIEYIKVSVRFPNGTPSSVMTDITMLISRSMLPIGNWDFIDGLFPDFNTQWPILQYHWEYLGRAGDDSFVVSHRGQELHGGKGWAANVTMATGCPTAISWFDYRLHDYPPYAGYSVSLTLTRSAA